MSSVSGRRYHAPWSGLHTKLACSGGAAAAGEEEEEAAGAGSHSDRSYSFQNWRLTRIWAGFKPPPKKKVQSRRLGVARGEMSHMKDQFVQYGLQVGPMSLEAKMV